MLALASYPVLIEPNLGLSAQFTFWLGGLVGGGFALKNAALRDLRHAKHRLRVVRDAREHWTFWKLVEAPLEPATPKA